MPDGQTEPRYLAVGRIARPWGVRGELKVEILTEDPARFEWLETVYVGPRFTPYRLESSRQHLGAVLLKLAGCDDRNAAEALRGLVVQVPIKDALPLEEGEYWVHQILGLEVWTTEGEGDQSQRRLRRPGSGRAPGAHPGLEKRRARHKFGGSTGVGGTAGGIGLSGF
jgi:ribosomal 30S subunit maturation factor RimM